MHLDQWFPVCLSEYEEMVRVIDISSLKKILL